MSEKTASNHIPHVLHGLTTTGLLRYARICEAQGRVRAAAWGRKFRDDDYLCGCMVAFFAAQRADLIPAHWIFDTLGGGKPLARLIDQPHQPVTPERFWLEMDMDDQTLRIMRGDTKLVWKPFPTTNTAWHSVEELMGDETNRQVWDALCALVEMANAWQEEGAPHLRLDGHSDKELMAELVRRGYEAPAPPQVREKK